MWIKWSDSGEKEVDGRGKRGKLGTIYYNIESTIIKIHELRIRPNLKGQEEEDSNKLESKKLPQSRFKNWG